jgi:crotonobetainyl-CoA:carnitine CoA-transferase CaiB-like acyl-CoA transferase
LCRSLLERPDLASDSRFATNSARVTNREELIAELIPLVRRHSTAWWLEGLRSVGVPTGAVRAVGEALAAPETAAREMVATVPHPTAGAVRLVASPLKLSRTPVAKPTAPPLLGQDTDQVLQSLGYDESAIDALSAAGVTC